MSLINIEPFVMWPKASGPLTAFTGLTLNSTTTKNGYITMVPHTGTINNVLIRTRAVTSSQTLKVSLQGVDANGKPDGTILGVGNSAFGTQGSLVLDTVYTVVLGTPLAVTRGTYIAVVVEWSGTQGNITMAQATGTICNNFYTATFAAAAWTITASGVAPVVGFEYTDGFHGETTYPLSLITATTYNSGSTPDEIGCYINNVVDTIVCGAYAYIDKDAACTIKLYDASDNVLESSVLAVNNRWVNSIGFDYVHFATNVTLYKNTVYRLTLLPTSGSSITLGEYTLPSAAAMNSLSLGTAFYRTSRSDAGAWTQDATSRPIIGLFCRATGNSDSGGSSGLYL